MTTPASTVEVDEPMADQIIVNGAGDEEEDTEKKQDMNGTTAAADKGAEDEEAGIVKAEDGGEAEAADEDAEMPPPKTPTEASSTPTSANTRTSTRKRRSAAPIFGTKSSESNTSSTTSGGGTPQEQQSPSPAKLRKTMTPKGKPPPTKGTPPRINLDEETEQHNGTKGKQEHDTSGGSAADPFDFSTQSAVHPEPLKNISIERASFNEVKFTKSLPSSAERYANMEKIAASRNPQLAASLSSPNSQDCPSSLSQLSALTNSSLRLALDTSSGGGTPKTITSASRSTAASSAGRKKRGGGGRVVGRTPKRAAATKVKRGESASEEDEEEEEEEEDEDVEKQEPMELNSPAISKKRSTPKLTTPNAGGGSAAVMLKTPSSAKKAEEAAKAAKEKKRKEAEEELYRVPELTSDEQVDVDWLKEGHLFMGDGARVLALWGTEYYAANICGREALGRYYVHFVEDNLNRVLPPSGVIPISALHSGTKVSFIDTVEGDEMGKHSEVVEQPHTDPAGDWVRGEFKLRELDEEGKAAPESKTVLWAKLYLTREQAQQVLQAQKQKPTVASPRSARRSGSGSATGGGNPVQRVDEENIIAESRTARRSRGAALARLSSGSATSAAAAAAGASDTSMETATPTPPRTPRVQRQQPGTPQKQQQKSPATSSTGRRGRPPASLAPVKEEKAKEEVEAKGHDDAAEEGTEETVADAVNKAGEEGAAAVAADGEEKMEVDGGDEAALPALNRKKSLSPRQSSASSASATASGSRRSPRGQPQAEHPQKQQQQVVEKAEQKEEPEKKTAIFAGLKFVLTSATRPNKKATDFNKRKYREMIEVRGGQIIEDFSDLTTPADETAAYLIADTYYRTHKYLSALSLSIPCVSYRWIQECVAENKLTDHQLLLLPAGESSLDPNQQFEWKPLKGILMQGKRVLIHSTVTFVEQGAVGFAEIWTPILRNLGATLVGIGDDEPFSATHAGSSTLEEKLAFINEKIDPPIDVFLTETDCVLELAQQAQTRGALAVSSEWVIQAIVTGALPDVDAPGGERFRYDFV